MGAMVLFGVIGFMDDFLKIRKKRSLGLTGRQKIVLQLASAAVIGLILIYLGMNGKFSLDISFPFVKTLTTYLGWFYLPWIIFILLGSTNAVNLADGL